MATRPRVDVQCLAALGCFAAILASPGRADPIRPWAGARAHVTAADQSISNSGRTASASAVGEGIVSYINYEYGGPAFKQTVQGSGMAEATGRPNSLLRVGSSYGTAVFGSRPAEVGKPPFLASAQWEGDAITIQPPVGGPMPGSVRLELAFDFSVYAHWDAGSFELKAGDKTVGKSLFLYPGESGSRMAIEALRSSVASPIFDTLHIGLDEEPGSEFLEGHATLHLDLLLDEYGRSDPFSLSLMSNAVPDGTHSNTSEAAIHRDFTLSLLDITLPDGTSATSAGYAVSFDSGLSWPQPVPEPLPAAAWAIVGLAGAFIVRRRAVKASIN